MSSCHCGKNGHAFNSINCETHGTMNKAITKMNKLQEEVMNGFYGTKNRVKMIQSLEFIKSAMEKHV